MKLEIVKEYESLLDRTWFWAVVDGQKKVCCGDEQEAHEAIMRIKSGLTKTETVVYSEFFEVIEA